MYIYNYVYMIVLEHITRGGGGREISRNEDIYSGWLYYFLACTPSKLSVNFPPFSSAVAE